MGKPTGYECADRGLDPELFFPGKGQTVPLSVMQACQACRMRRACLAETMAVENGSQFSRHGVFGGYTPVGRARLARGEPSRRVFDGLDSLAVEIRQRRSARRREREQVTGA